jgi:hypothetical protein
VQDLEQLHLESIQIALYRFAQEPRIVHSPLRLFRSENKKKEG